MQLGMIGLGRMGSNMVRRLIKNGHRCVVFDQLPKAVKDLAKGKSGRRSFTRGSGQKTRQAARHSG